VAIARSCCADGEARRLRIGARLSLHDVARGVGVNASTASRWERGLNFPQHAQAIRYAAFLTELAAVLDPENRTAPVASQGGSKTEADGPHAQV